jgi:hypothetical protein
MSDKIEYCTLDLNLSICSNARDVIAKIDAVISELLVTALPSVQNGQYAEYEIDTGQTKQKVKYNDPSEVVNTISLYRKLRKQYENDIIPRRVSLVDSKSIR